MTDERQHEASPDSLSSEENVDAPVGEASETPAQADAEERRAEDVEAGETMAEQAEMARSDDSSEPSGEEEPAPVADAEESQQDDSDADATEESEPVAAPKKSGRKSSPAPLELIEEPDEVEDDIEKDWYILKVAVNRENTVRDNLERRVKVAGLDRYFGDIVVPVEESTEFNKDGKKRTIRKKLFPGYIVIHMSINDDSWFLVRETPGIGDFTGAAGKPAPLPSAEIDRILAAGKTDDDDAKPVTTLKYKVGDKVRVKDGYFQSFEGDIETVDEANGRITVLLEVFGRLTPVELGHWEVESVD